MSTAASHRRNVLRVPPRRHRRERGIQEAALYGIPCAIGNRRERDPKLWATAYHEAGHAVVGYYARTMPRLRRVTIVPDSKAGTLGHVAHHPSPAFVRRIEEGDWSPRTVIRFYEGIQTLYAGPLAESRFTGRSNHVGAASDYRIITDLALRAAGYGAQAVTGALLRWIRLLRAAQLNTRWREVKAVAKALVEHKTLRGHDAVRTVIHDALDIPQRTARIAALLDSRKAPP